MKILIVDDSWRVARALAALLQREGHQTRTAGDGEEALHMAQSEAFELFILDMMMPSMDGIELCRRLRRSRVNSPILMLSAKEAGEDVVQGLDAGADDYLVKPCDPEILKARVRALARRRHITRELVLKIEDLELDMLHNRFSVGGQPVVLSLIELSIMQLFMMHFRQTLSGEEILQHAWGRGYQGSPNLVRMSILRLRQKINESVVSIETARGKGYRLDLISVSD